MDAPLIPGVGAYRWVWEEIDRTSADLLVLCGNHAFRWGVDLRSARPDSPVTIIHSNALNYLQLRTRRVFLLADEAEFGRQLYEVFRLCRDKGIDALFIGAFYLNSSKVAELQRGSSADYLEGLGGEDAVFANALRAVRGWKEYRNDADFHREAIIDLASNMRRLASAPFNADATIVHVKSIDGESGFLHQMYAATNECGWWYHPNEHVATFVVSTYDPRPVIAPFGEAVSLVHQRALVKFYRPLEGNEVVASPMVLAEIEVRPGKLNDLAKPSRKPSSMAESIVSAGMAQLDPTTSEESRLLAFYDLLSCALDLDLASHMRSIAGVGIEVSPDRDSAALFYGPDLGKVLFEIANAFFAGSISAQVVTSASSVAGSHDDHLGPANVDLSQLMLCKAHIYEVFERTNDGAKDPILRRRAGLCFKELRDATHIDAETLVCCIDALCELEWTEPFNDARRNPDGALTLARCYNSTHAGLDKFMTRVIDALRTHDMPTHAVFLNKCISFLIQTCREAPLDDVQIEGYLYGKQVRFKIDDEEPLYLREFLRSAGFQERKDGQYELPPGAAGSGDSGAPGDECFMVIEPGVMELGLEQFFEVHNATKDAIKEVRDERVETHLSDAIAVFVDMVGFKYPENGFVTLADNLGKVSAKARKGDYSAAVEHLLVVRKKVSKFRYYEWTLKAIHSRFVPKAGFGPTDKLMGKYAYLNKDSPIWVFVEKELDYCQARLRRKDFPGPLSPFVLLLRALGGEKDAHLRQGTPPLNEPVRRTLVSVDMRGSKKATPSRLSAHWLSYAQNILAVWAHWFGGEWVNFCGDEGIFAFASEAAAKAFAGAAWYHLNGLAQTVLRGRVASDSVGFGAGIAEGLITYEEVHGKPSIIRSGGQAFDPVARASQLAKRGTTICEDTGAGTQDRTLLAHELFKEYVLKHSKERWK